MKTAFCRQVAWPSAKISGRETSAAVRWVRSTTAQSGSQARSVSSVDPPVATASVRAPMCLPQATSLGVSPITTISGPSSLHLEVVAALGRSGDGDEVAILVVVGKAAQRKPVPQPVRTELAPSSLANVAGQQAKQLARPATRPSRRATSPRRGTARPRLCQDDCPQGEGSD